MGVLALMKKLSLQHRTLRTAEPGFKAGDRVVQPPSLVALRGWRQTDDMVWVLCGGLQAKEEGKHQTTSVRNEAVICLLDGSFLHWSDRQIGNRMIFGQR